MNIIKNIILLPLLPLRWAWKWSGNTEINGQKSGCAHVLGAALNAVILYGLIVGGISYLVGLFIK